jgi:fumarate reductase flavoprotein subunit
LCFVRDNPRTNGSYIEQKAKAQTLVWSSSQGKNRKAIRAQRKQGAGIITKGGSMKDSKKRIDQAEEASQKISRRGFIAGASTLGALVASGLALSGCSNGSGDAQSLAGSTPAASQGGKTIWTLDEVGAPTETISADLVVIGGGGSGLTASIQASQLGLNVLVLEKATFAGGSYSCTEGIFVFSSHWQEEAGINYDLNDSIQQIMDYHHWLPSSAVYHTWFTKTAETVDWLESAGVEFGGLATLGAWANTFLAWKHDPENPLPGTAAAKSLIKAAEDAGVEFLFSTPGKKILTEGGKVTGVLAEKEDGTVVQIDTSAVIISSGGYGMNDEMLKELAHFAGTPFEPGTPGRVGDGIKMGIDAGAKLWDFPGTVPLLGPMTIGATWPSPPIALSLSAVLWLNQDCERFIREDLTNINFSFSGNAAKAQKRVLAVFTEKDLEHFENVGPYSPVFTLTAEGTPMTGITDAIQELMKNGDSVYYAETLEELAKQANLDPQALTKNIDAYNALCAKGLDDQFGKQSKYLHALESGPYYALECAVGFTGTCGGLVVNTEAQCVDENDVPIGGLYATGCDTGGLMGDSYDSNLCAGSMASWAVNSGRMAAQGAAAYLKG